MRILRTIAIAFAQYSRIPMPRFEWKDEDMRYTISAFPLVGAVLGLVFFAVYRACARLALPDAASALLLTAVPVIITGGFHIDGFMDAADALSSFRSKEEKLRILKDPHIGAFAVIRLTVCGLIYIASLIIVLVSGKAQELMISISAGFVLARCLSALSVLTFRSAKKEGMLYYEASSAAGGRTVNMIVVSILGVAAACLMAWFSGLAGALVILLAGFSFSWYRYISYKEFGGITGDTAGYFVVICETAMAAGAAAAAVILTL